MKFKKTAAELAALCGGRLEGDGAVELASAAGLSDAGPADVSFLGNPKYAPAAGTTRAGCVFLPNSNKDAACPAPAKIFVDDPQYAFSLVLGLAAAAQPKPKPGVDARAYVAPGAKVPASCSIAPFAVVEEGAELGENVVIGAQCYIGRNVKIGKDSLFHPRVTVREECVIGARVILQPGCVIGGDGYGFSTDRKTGKHRKIAQMGNVIIGDDVEIGANSTIDRGTIGPTVIGEGTKVDNLVQLAHNVRTGKDCLIISQVGVSGSTSLGDRVILAGQAGLAGHVHIGDGAIVMAQAGVMSDLEKGAVVFGSPCRPRREELKVHTLSSRLPEIYDSLKEIKKKLGLGEKEPNAHA
jgi:UDP-3-O-[3-hydroxymyristoyl] glucosamine N-acyltransferase